MMTDNNTLEQDLTRLKITDHAEKRYAERIMDKNSVWDVNNYIAQNKDKIKTDILKMLQYGEILYYGKQKTNPKNKSNNYVHVYLKDLWVLIVDYQSNNVVTLYKIDLGLGDDFNREYVTKLKEKLIYAQEELEVIKDSCNEAKKTYKNIIADNVDLINEYKGYINNLEKQNSGYIEVIDSIDADIYPKEDKVKEILNTMIGKKEF